MHPGEYPFKFMKDINWLAAELHEQGDRSVTELRNGVVIVAGRSNNYQIELRMLENTSTGLERAETVGVQYNRLLGQQLDSKVFLHQTAPPRPIVERTKNLAIHSRVTASTAEGRVTALKIAGARRITSQNQEMPPPTRNAKVVARATSVGVMSTLRKNTMTFADVLSTGLAIRGARSCEGCDAGQ